MVGERGVYNGRGRGVCTMVGERGVYNGRRGVYNGRGEGCVQW